METGLKSSVVGCLEISELERNREKKEEQLRKLNLIYQNYSVELAALKDKLKKDPNDIVRQARLKLIQEQLMPRICDLILHLES